MRKAFLSGVCSGRAIVYKFDEKSTCECLKSESTAKKPFKFLGGHIHTYLSPYGVTRDRGILCTSGVLPEVVRRY